MTPKLMSYNQSDFQSKAHMEMSIAEIEVAPILRYDKTLR